MTTRCETLDKSLAVGIPTYLEQDTISESVLSALEHPAVAHVFVFDRSPGAESLAAIEGLELPTDRVSLVWSRASSPLVNFRMLGETMLADPREFKSLAFLAGDDWWGQSSDDELELLLSGPQDKVLFPRFVWVGPGTQRSVPRLNLPRRQPKARLLVAMACAMRSEVAQLIYAIHCRDSFADLVGLIDEVERENDQDLYGVDVSIALALIADYRLEPCSTLTIFRREAQVPGVAEARLGLPQSPRDMSARQARRYAVSVQMRSFRLVAETLLTRHQASTASTKALPITWTLVFVVEALLTKLRRLVPVPVTDGHFRERSVNRSGE